MVIEVCSWFLCRKGTVYDCFSGCYSTLERGDARRYKMSRLKNKAPRIITYHLITPYFHYGFKQNGHAKFEKTGIRQWHI